MQIITNKTDLLALVKQCASVADPSSPNPMVSCMLLESKTDHEGCFLVIKATSFYLTIKGQIKAFFEGPIEPFSYVVNSKTFMERIDKMPEGEIILEAGDILQIKTKHSARKYNVLYFPGLEYPHIDDPDPDWKLHISPDTLLDLVSRVEFSVSRDTTRPALNSALIEFHPSAVVSVSTDGHRLSKLQIITPADTKDYDASEFRGITNSEITFLLSLRSLAIIKKIANDALERDHSISFYKKNETVHFFIEETSMVFSTICTTEQFPNYQQVIPKTYKHGAKVNRERMIEALKAIKVSTNSRTGGVSVSLERKPDSTDELGTITISAEDAEKGEGVDEFEIGYTGAPYKIGFHANYLIEALSAMPCSHVHFGISGEFDPITVKPHIDCNFHGGDFVAVVMPMRL